MLPRLCGCLLEFIHTPEPLLLQLPLYITQSLGYQFGTTDYQKISLQITRKYLLSTRCQSATASINKESSFLDITSTSGRFRGYARWFRCLGHDLANLFCSLCAKAQRRITAQIFPRVEYGVDSTSRSLKYGTGRKVLPFQSPPLFLLHNPKHFQWLVPCSS